VYQLFLLPNEAAHIQAIKQILRAYQCTDNSSGIIKALRELSREQYLKQTTSGSGEYVQSLLQLFGASWKDNQEDLVAARSAAGLLLDNLINVPSFPRGLLAPIYYMRGWIHYSLENLEQAITDFTRALELDPSYIADYLALGIVSREFHDLRSSLVALDRALELDPTSAIVYMNRGWTYHWSGETQLALDDFNRALELDPQVTEAYNGRGWVHIVLKEYEQALDDFNHALELNPKSRDALHGRGGVYVQLKEYEHAIADFDHYLEIDKANPYVYLRRGIAYAGLKNHQQALADFDRALTLDPKNTKVYLYPEVYHYRGLTYLWLQDIKRGCADLTRATEGDSARIFYSWRVEWVNMCQQKPDSGIAARLEAIATADPTRCSAYVCKGVALWFRKNYEEALTELEQAIQQVPEEWDSYFWKGMAFLSLEREEEAVEAIKKALDEGMPPILLTPLRWFEQEKPDFYEKQVVPLLAKYV